MTRLLIALMLCSILGQAAAAPAVVRLLQAPAWRERGQQREPLRVGLELDGGDRIVTGAGARVLFALAEGSVVKLGENADFALNELSPPADESGVFKGVLDVLKGAFRFTTTIAGRKRDIQAQVRSATIGIRGTDVWGKAEDARDFVVLLEGRISITRDGQEYDLTAANSLFMAPRGQAAQPIGPVDPADLGRWAQETEPQAGQGVAQGDGRFHLNLASFATADGAQALLERLAAAGYAAQIEEADVDGRHWWRVLLAGFVARDDAAAVAAALREPFALSSPWIGSAPR